MSNKSFSKKNRIDLSDEYYIESDGSNGICLVFHEFRERKTKEGEKEQFLYEDRTYHNRLVQSLKVYCDLTENKSKTLEELIAKVDYNKELLEKLDKEFRQYE